MFWKIVLLSGSSTFILILTTHKKFSHFILKIGKYHVHHSVNGLILVLAGRVFGHSFHSLISAAGLGMYISHVFEEMIINKNRFLIALTTFITPILPHHMEKSNN